MIHPARRACIAAAIALLCAQPMFAHADTSWPSKPITFVIPGAAGGSTDIPARFLAIKLGERLGQPIVVDNKPGAGGSLGSGIVARAQPDGYTVLVGNSGSNAINYSAYKKLSYKPTDFIALTDMISFANVLVVPSKSPIKSLPQLIDTARKEPGKLAFSSAGVGQTTHLMGELLRQSAGVDVVHVPYKGSAELMRATMAGEVMVAADTSAVIPYVNEGRMVALNVWTEKRLPTLPNTPTLIELGLPTTQYSPFGLVAPKNLPADVQKRLHDAFKQAMEMDSYQAMLQRFEMLPIYMNSADYKKFAADSTIKEKAALAKLGPQAQ